MHGCKICTLCIFSKLKHFSERLALKKELPKFIIYVNLGDNGSEPFTTHSSMCPVTAISVIIGSNMTKDAQVVLAVLRLTSSSVSAGAGVVVVGAVVVTTLVGTSVVVGGLVVVTVLAGTCVVVGTAVVGAAVDVVGGKGAEEARVTQRCPSLEAKFAL